MIEAISLLAGLGVSYFAGYQVVAAVHAAVRLVKARRSREAAQKALKASYLIAFHRARDFTVAEAKRQNRLVEEMKAGRFIPTPETVEAQRAGARECDRLIAAYERIERRMNR